MISHFIFSICYTVVSIFRFNMTRFGSFDLSPNGQIFTSLSNSYQILSTFTIFSCLSDIFLACMTWFILQDEPQFFKDVKFNRTYEILDIIKERKTYSVAISSDTQLDDQNEDDANDYRITQYLSDRMIAMFLDTDVDEGPDRDWTFNEDISFLENDAVVD